MNKNSPDLLQECSSNLEKLTLAGHGPHTAQQIAVLTAQPHDLATPGAQDDLSARVIRDLPDVLALPCKLLGGRNPARLLRCWELLLGRSYTETRRPVQNDNCVLLLKETWMQHLEFCAHCSN